MMQTGIPWEEAYPQATHTYVEALFQGYTSDEAIQLARQKLNLP
jgi:hypothetical protein